ncbi:MAG: sporulation protein YabP [Oscillospiraceae bacterium]|nr:sporulation protein YabP [Oscillospiraceae bacterium]
MPEEKRMGKSPHNVILEDRRKLSVSGVSDIDSFDEETVVLFTDLGELTVRGLDLHINRLNVETGELTLEGEIHTLIYTDDQPNKKLFARLFK